MQARVVDTRRNEKGRSRRTPRKSQDLPNWTLSKPLPKGLKGGSLRLKGDERILGDSDFVMDALKASEEQLERKYRLKAEGYMSNARTSLTQV